MSTLEEAESRLRSAKSQIITMASHEPSQFNSVEWKVQHFYQSCMALGFIESDREKPLMKMINALGGWEVLRSFNIYSWDSHRYSIFTFLLANGCANHFTNAREHKTKTKTLN